MTNIQERNCKYQYRKQEPLNNCHEKRGDNSVAEAVVLPGDLEEMKCMRRLPKLGKTYESDCDMRLSSFNDSLKNISRTIRCGMVRFYRQIDLAL